MNGNVISGENDYQHSMIRLTITLKEFMNGCRVPDCLGKGKQEQRYQR